MSFGLVNLCQFRIIFGLPAVQSNRLLTRRRRFFEFASALVHSPESRKNLAIARMQSLRFVVSRQRFIVMPLQFLGVSQHDISRRILRPHLHKQVRFPHRAFRQPRVIANRRPQRVRIWRFRRQRHRLRRFPIRGDPILRHPQQMRVNQSRIRIPGLLAHLCFHRSKRMIPIAPHHRSRHFIQIVRRPWQSQVQLPYRARRIRVSHHLYRLDVRSCRRQRIQQRLFRTFRQSSSFQFLAYLLLCQSFQLPRQYLFRRNRRTLLRIKTFLLRWESQSCEQRQSDHRVRLARRINAIRPTSVYRRRGTFASIFSVFLPNLPPSPQPTVTITPAWAYNH